MLVAEENPELKPAQPLYDVLPSPNVGAADFTISAAPGISVPQGRSANARLLILPWGTFSDESHLTASALPDGVKATFDPAVTKESSLLMQVASPSAKPSTSTIAVNATSGMLSHSVRSRSSVTPILSGAIPVDQSSAFNITGIYKDGAKFDEAASLDAGGYALSEKLVGSEQVGAEVIFKLGGAGRPDVVFGETVELPEGKYSSLIILGIGVEGR